MSPKIFHPSLGPSNLSLSVRSSKLCQMIFLSDTLKTEIWTGIFFANCQTSFEQGLCSLIVRNFLNTLIQVAIHNCLRRSEELGRNWETKHATSAEFSSIRERTYSYTLFTICICIQLRSVLLRTRLLARCRTSCNCSPFKGPSICLALSISKVSHTRGRTPLTRCNASAHALLVRKSFLLHRCSLLGLMIE